MRKAFVIITAIMMFAAGALISSFAEDQRISIPVTHQIEGNETLTTVNMTFILTAKNGAPMPEGSEGDTKRMVVPANSTFDFGTLPITKPGIYEYTVSRKTEQSERLTMDDSVYDVKVAVFSDGEPAVIYVKEGEEGKSEKIVYKDSYYYMLSFDLDGGTINGDPGPIVIYYTGETVIHLPDAPEKDGYVFDYWKGSRYEAGAEYTVSEDHKFEATYKLASKDNDKDNNKKNKESTAKTGENNAIIILCITFALAVGMYFFVTKRKEKNREKKNPK